MDVKSILHKLHLILYFGAGVSNSVAERAKTENCDYAEGQTGFIKQDIGVQTYSLATFFSYEHVLEPDVWHLFFSC